MKLDPASTLLPPWPFHVIGTRRRGREGAAGLWCGRCVGQTWLKSSFAEKHVRLVRIRWFGVHVALAQLPKLHRAFKKLL